MSDRVSASSPASPAPATIREPYPHRVAQRIGFIGLGRMGRVMAANLAAAGYRVTAYVRRPERSPELVALGLETTNDIKDLFELDFVITMLPDDTAAREIVFGHDAGSAHSGLAAGLKQGAVHLSMSTLSTTVSAQMAEAHQKRAQGYVAAPVFGNPDAAKARELFIVAAGAPDQVSCCLPIFDILGQRSFVIGTDPSSANLVKLAGNVMTATALEVLGEVFALLRKRGLDPAPFLEIVTGTMFGGRVHKIYGAKIAAQNYPASGFVFPLALKDVRLALAEADSAGVPMPSVSVVHDRLLTGVARGYATLDWSALGLLAAEQAGLETKATQTQS